MNILLISYGIKEYDGRLAEIYKMSKLIGDVTLVCIGKDKSKNLNENIVKLNKTKYLSLKLYLQFLFTCIITAKKMKNIDIVISDNLFASIPTLVIKALFKPKNIIQDVRELYFYTDVKGKSSKIFCKYETILLKKADIILVANKYRSEIMYERYNLSAPPLVFENIRFLTGEYSKLELDEKYKSYFNYKINIVSTGGLSVLRTTDKLVGSMVKLPIDYGLYIVGSGTDKDKKVIKDIIVNNNLNNVFLIDKVPLPELRYIVQQCDIGIVNYHKNDLNNKYCASGKVYEYLAEGLPIVTTENIPLKEFCGKYRVGESDDLFYNGILKVSESLSEYKSRVRSFIEGVSVDEYNEKIATEILEIINNEDTILN